MTWKQTASSTALQMCCLVVWAVMPHRVPRASDLGGELELEQEDDMEERYDLQ